MGGGSVEKVTRRLVYVKFYVWLLNFIIRLSGISRMDSGASLNSTVSASR